MDAKKRTVTKSASLLSKIAEMRSPNASFGPCRNHRNCREYSTTLGNGYCQRCWDRGLGSQDSDWDWLPEHGGKKPLTERTLLSIRDVQARLNLGRRTVFKLIEDGRLRSEKRGKSRKIYLADVEAYLAERHEEEDTAR